MKYFILQETTEIHAFILEPTWQSKQGAGYSFET